MRLSNFGLIKGAKDWISASFSVFMLRAYGFVFSAGGLWFRVGSRVCG